MSKQPLPLAALDNVISATDDTLAIPYPCPECQSFHRVHQEEGATLTPEPERRLIVRQAAG
jgi:hypothetical protein